MKEKEWIDRENIYKKKIQNKQFTRQGLITRIEGLKISEKEKVERIDKLNKRIDEEIEIIEIQIKNLEASCFYCGKKLGSYWGICCNECKTKGITTEQALMDCEMNESNN